MVVAHPSIQKFISELWVGHLLTWPSWKFMLLFFLQILIPPLWVIFAIPSKHKLKRVPIIKYMSYLVSHINLIIILILTVVWPVYPIATMTSIWPSWIEWMLLAWLSGILVSELTNPSSRSGLGWIRVLVIVISTLGVDVHVAAFFTDKSNHHEFIYIRNQFFATSLLLCCLQLLDFLIFHHLFGPWAIIIRDLMKDLIRFMVILFLFIFGFCLNITAIYQPIKPPIKNDTFLGTGDGSGGSVTMNFSKVLEMLFFSLFGLIEPENLPPLHRNPDWSTILTKVMFGLYLIISLIVLVNLLIALLSDTYQRIQAQSDVEWKFGRAKLFMNLTKTATTPAPFNLLTKLYIYVRILLKYKSQSCITNIQAFIDEFEDIQDNFDDFDHSTSIRNWNTKVNPKSKIISLGIVYICYNISIYFQKSW
ncbi:hypothetical protein A3Q56_08140 [Intoshia linei]|uniref:Ion transport domain-containing protein n=1 Tax=Intoshia linei TaxID=1819745 RepID=A0A177ARW5_9BILA|nr:hypothetical protein A3Q56_08140 [Intoshia linei]